MRNEVTSVISGLVDRGNEFRYQVLLIGSKERSSST